MKIIVTDQQGQEHILDALEGWRVMEIIRDWDLDIKAECGGCASCATCHVYVDPQWISKMPPLSSEEEEMLDTVPDLQDNSRLSCQLIMREEWDGLRVSLAHSASKK